MRSPETCGVSGIFRPVRGPTSGRRAGVSRRVGVRAFVSACLLLLALASIAFAQGSEDDVGYDILRRRGPDPIDQINAALHRWSKVFFVVGAVLLGIVTLKIVNPLEVYHGTNEKLLKRAVRGVDELIKRIEKEAETTTSETEEEEPPTEAGILAGMAEITEFDQAEEVPAYVLTVNDRMLDSIRVTLKRLRRFQESHAERYRGYMFSVLKGIKTITEQCEHSEAPSSLAVDVKGYFRDEPRYRAWTKLLRRIGHKGDYEEFVDSFMLFMRDVKEGRPLATPEKAAASVEKTTVIVGPQAPEIPHVLNEETLPEIQQAGAKEAADLVSLVRTGRPSSRDHAWQFEFVRRQQQLHLRDESKKMLIVFLSCERKALPRITKTRMLPCRTWPHVVYMLGVKSGPVLLQRVEDRMLTIQEIIILQKAFLQTFAKKGSLAHIYGLGEEAELMMNLHVPQIRRETLVLLRRCHETEPNRFDRATQELNEEETPQHDEVTKFIRHYIHDRHDPPEMA